VTDSLTATEPQPWELVAIDSEWPLIAAELALLDAEIVALTVEGGLSAMDWRRLRRAERHVLREALALARIGYVVPPSLRECLSPASVAVESEDKEVA